MCFFYLEKDTTSKFNVFQTKDMENLSFSIVKVNWYNEKNQFILIIVPKCVGKLLTEEMVHNITTNKGYFSPNIYQLYMQVTVSL